jgi:hypothetical protein
MDGWIEELWETIEDEWTFMYVVDVYFYSVVLVLVMIKIELIVLWQNQ